MGIFLVLDEGFWWKLWCQILGSDCLALRVGPSPPSGRRSLLLKGSPGIDSGMTRWLCPVSLLTLAISNFGMTHRFFLFSCFWTSCIVFFLTYLLITLRVNLDSTLATVTVFWYFFKIYFLYLEGTSTLVLCFLSFTFFFFLNFHRFWENRWYLVT